MNARRAFERACEGKVKHRRRKAETEAARISRSEGDRAKSRGLPQPHAVRPYRCQFCKAWHCGHEKATT
jgi:hypothetical protein